MKKPSRTPYWFRPLTLGVLVVWTILGSPGALAQAPPTCPCTLFGALTPDQAFDARGSGQGQSDSGDGSTVELGIKVRPSINGFITGVRFYKSALNTGPHVVNLWTTTGVLLSTATTTTETASGWQEVTLQNPVPVAANTTYVASYFAPHGHYAFNLGFFATSDYTNGPLTGPSVPNGGGDAYKYSSASVFPDQGVAGNYWADVVFNTSVSTDTTPPTVTSVVPAANVSGYNVGTNVSAIFSEPIDPNTVTATTFTLRDDSNALVTGTVTYNTLLRQATFDPTAGLMPATTYTAKLAGGASGVADLAGNRLTSDFSWSFTTGSAATAPPDSGPGGPILVIANASLPYGRYYAEILRAEGLNEFTVTDLSSLSAATLASYDVAILAETALTDAQASTLTAWVNGGGRLIAMRPDKRLASLLGLIDASATLGDAYMLLNTASGPGAGLVNQTIQFHGVADRYTLNGASSIATLYADAATPTPNPAATIRSVGVSGGQAAAFTFDVARSVVYTRQGNPAWAGQERDGIVPIRSDDLYYGNAAADPKPDYVDLNKVTIPQADELQRLLANLAIQMTLAAKPLPRFWYLPWNLKAVVVMTGDDGGGGMTAGRFDHFATLSAPGCNAANWECVRSTSNLLVPGVLTSAQASDYMSRGFDLGIQLNTSCADYTATSLDPVMTTTLAAFAAAIPTLPAPITNRTLCLVWSDWATQAKVEASHGVRFDTTYYYWPASWIGGRWAGLFTGSGMPQRFADLDGTMIDAYQAVTQMNDETAQGYPATINTLLDNAIGPNGYYGAFTANMHEYQALSAAADFIVGSAQARGVPVISARQMVTWLDGRNGSSFGNLVWSGTGLDFTVTAAHGANGLQAMLPANSPVGALGGVTFNGTPVAYTLQIVKGIQYAVFAANTGSYHASYNVPSITMTPSVSLPEGNSGTTPFTFTVNLSTASASTVTVGYATSDGTATAGSDYVAQSGTLTLAPGETTKTVTVLVIGDTIGEPDETFFVNLSGATNAAIATPVSVGTILNDDAIPSLSINDVALPEGNAGTTPFTFTVSLSSASQQAMTVQYATANGTAKAGIDYVAQSGTLTFPAGTTTQAINILVVGNTLSEPSKTFTVLLSAPSAATLAKGQGVGTILNDDTGPAVTDRFPVANSTNVPTGTAVDVWFGTTMNPATLTTATFKVRAAGADVPGVVYLSNDSYKIGTSGSTARFAPTAPFAPNTVFTVTLLGTVADQAGNAIATDTSWSFSTGNGPQACPCRLFDSLAPTQIYDIRGTGLGQADSGDGTPVEVGVRFKPSISGLITGLRFYKSTLNAGTHIANLWTASGALLATATYTTETASGWQEVTLPSPVPVTANTTYVASTYMPVGHYGYNRDFLMFSGYTNGPLTALSAPETGGNGVYKYSPVSAFPDQGIAADYWVDVVMSAPSISISDVSQLEGNSGTTNFNFTVSLTAASQATVTVGYATADGTATAGSDYTAQTGTLTFLPGETSKAITVPVIGDTIVEPDETFSVNLSNATQAFIAKATGVGTILNDDSALTLSIADVAQNEGNSGTTNFTFPVTLSAPSAQAVTVNYATADVTATAGSDYTAQSGTLTFAPNTTTQTITVAVNGDTLFEADETFTVTLTSPSGATLSRAQATGTIRNDDAAPSWSINDVSLNEGNSGVTNFVFNVTLSAAAGVSMTVSYATADGTATAPSDYTAKSGLLTFPPGTTLQTVTVAVNGDLLVEPDETFTVTLSSPSAGILTKGQGIGTIRNDDLPPTIISRAPAPGAANVAASTAIIAGFSHAMNPASLIATTFRLRASGAATDIAATISYSGVNATLTPNAPLAAATTYNVTVAGTVADTAGNLLGADATWSFTTGTGAVPTLIDTTVADFAAGTLTNTAVGQRADGEVTLGPAAGSTFEGTSLDAGWTGVPWSTGGTAVVSGGSLTVNGARANTNALFAPTHTLEFAAVFSTTSAFQHIGLGIDFNNPPWAMFSTLTGGGLWARTSNGTTSTNTQIPGSWLGALHVFRIDWNSSSVVYSIDGTQVVSHPIAIAASLRPVVSDFTVDAQSLRTDWMVMNPYAASGTFLSRVIDAGSPATWGAVTWTAATPIGTSLQISARRGNTSTPDATWTAFAPLTSGSAVGGTSRYLQYQASLATTDLTQTPSLQDIRFAVSYGPTLSINDVALLEGNAGTTAFTFSVTLANGTGSPISVDWATADGTATLANNDYSQAAGTLTFTAVGSQAQTITVAVIGDTAFEPDETFSVNLSNAPAATITKTQGLGTILNDDPDPSPPKVVGRSPAPSATTVAVTTTVTATFNKPMNSATIGAATFRLRAAGSASDVAATVTYSGVTATLTPSALLAGNTVYTVTVASTVADPLGQQLGADDTWTFTTASAVGYVQSASNSSDGSATTIVQAFPSANTVGNLIVAAVSWDPTGTLTCSDTLGNAYVVATQQYDGTNNQSLAICYAFNIKAGANTVTATFSISSTFRRLAIHEYRGVARTSPVDVVATNTANGTTTANAITSNAATTTAAGDLIFGAVMDDAGGTTITPGTGFVQRQRVATNDLATEDLVQTTTGSIAATHTFAAAHRYMAQMVAFKHQ